MARYKIADLTVEATLIGEYEQRGRPYETASSDPPDITISCDAKQVLELNPALKTEALAQYMGTGSLFSRKLLAFDGFQLHSSAVMLEGKAWLFSAPPGTGKSTHTEKWCRLFGATYLNDDKPVIRNRDGKWIVYGTPWSGKNDLSSPTCAELGGVAFLYRGSENTIYRLKPGDAVAILLSQCPHGMSRSQTEKQLTLLNGFLQEVPVWHLDCKNEDEAAFVSHRAMIGGA